MKIILDAKRVESMARDGKPVFVGQYRAYDKQIKPQDALFYSPERGFFQKGIERDGCDFEISVIDIQYAVRDTKSILDTGKNLMRGNAALVFFEYC
jgi:hypothetical protein